MYRSKILLLAAALSSACDYEGAECNFIWCDYDTDGEDVSEWDADLPVIDPGTDPCEVIADLSSMSLVWSDTVVYNAPLDTGRVPVLSNVADVAGWVENGPLGGAWWLSDDGARQRVEAVRIKTQGVESNPVTEGALVTFWTISNGPVWLRQTENGGLPDKEIKCDAYASVDEEWKIAVGTAPGLVDGYNFGGKWTLDTLSSTGILGVVGASRTAAEAEPNIGWGFDPVRDKRNAYRAWLPYGGVCYLALPSGLDESGS